MYDDVLLPTDGSSGTVRALDHAVAIAADNDATVHALYVVDTRRYRAASKDTQEDVIESLREAGERAIDDVAVRAADEGVPVETTLVEGVPHTEILDYAEAEGIDLVVMGRHGHRGPDRIANMGSTTERVLENAPVPALVVNLAE